MSISRSVLAYYLQSQFSSLAAAVGQSVDVEIGFASDIDSALRKLGIVEGDLVTATVEDGDRDKAFALAEYYAARRFWRLLSDRANVSIGGNSFNFAHLLANAKMLMEDAAKRAAALGVDVSGDGWSIGHLNLDWIESSAYS